MSVISNTTVQLDLRAFVTFVRLRALAIQTPPDDARSLEKHKPSHPMPTLVWLTRREDEQTAGRVPYRLMVPVDDAGLLTPDDLRVLEKAGENHA